MRSSKQRSRSKQNRNRSVGNVVNRVFDSSGPEGKVRGTPQQIIDKYNQLARDAQLAGDRVATENFQQHAEHYTRMLAEALREQEARREAQDQQNRDRQRDRQNDQRGEGNQNRGDQNQGNPQGGPQPDLADSEQPDVAPKPGGRAPRGAKPSGDDVIDVAEGDTGLVETPETASASAPEPVPANAEEAAETKPAPKPRRRTTKKAAPKPEATPEGDAPEAAE